jgi:hypothetical protein
VKLDSHERLQHAAIMAKNPAAVALGRLGGLKSTPAKRQALKGNLKKARKARAEKRERKAAELAIVRELEEQGDPPKAA